MPSEYPFLPEITKSLNRSISSLLSLWNKYQMDTQKQMKANNLRKTAWISPVYQLIFSKDKTITIVTRKL